MDDPTRALIEILLDEKGVRSDRWDVTFDLGDIPEPEVVAALASIACSAEELDHILVDMCGEALGGIWAELGRVDEPIFARLRPGARREALTALRLYAPHLVPAGAE
jgi:hypothetical protein